MRRRTISSLIAACALSACAHQTPPAPAAGGVAGMRWIAVDGEDPKLAFGVPDSDVLALMMTCEAGSGQVAIAVTGDGRARAVELRSGRAAQRLAAVVEPADASLVQTAAAAAGPVLASFARTGELAVGVDGRATALPAADTALAGGFVRRCRG